MKLAPLFNRQKILLEGRREYMAFINSFPYHAFKENVALDIKDHLKSELLWAERILKKSDRIIWWLKLVAIESFVFQTHFNASDVLIDKDFKYSLLAKMAIKNPKVYEDIMDDNFLDNTKRWLDHFSQIDYPPINDYPFVHQTPSEILTIFEIYEKEWQAKRTRNMSLGPDETIILSLGHHIWVDTGKASCKKEGEAGGHCGNSGRVDTKDRMYSLRKVLSNGKHYFQATFILDEEGWLTERKGYANEKPTVDTHPAIVEFLKLPFINGLKTSGHYLPENDFKIGDLSDELFQELVKDRADLVTDFNNCNSLLSKPENLIAFIDGRKRIRDSGSDRVWLINPNQLPDALYGISFFHQLTDNQFYDYLSLMWAISCPYGADTSVWLLYLKRRFGLNRLIKEADRLPRVLNFDSKSIKALMIVKKHIIEKKSHWLL